MSDTTPRQRAMLRTCAADMTAHGDPVIWDARESDELHIKGYSIIQLIKTSSIVIHTMDKTNLICINLFSCKPFDPESIVAFAKEATMKNSEFIKYVAGTRVHEPGLIGVAPYHNTYNDIESCYYAETRSLCFQPHPEFAGVAECTTYFFEVLERYYNDSPKKEAA